MSLPSVGESWSIGNYRDLMESKMMKSELYNELFQMPFNPDLRRGHV